MVRSKRSRKILLLPPPWWWEQEEEQEDLDLDSTEPVQLARMEPVYLDPQKNTNELTLTRVGLVSGSTSGEPVTPLILHFDQYLDTAGSTGDADESSGCGWNLQQFMGRNIRLVTPSGPLAEPPMAPDPLQTDRVGRWSVNAGLCPNLVITFHWSHCVVVVEQRRALAGPKWTRPDRTGLGQESAARTEAASGPKPHARNLLNNAPPLVCCNYCTTAQQQ